MQSILGLYSDAKYAAEAGEGLEKAGFSNEEFDFLTDTPYPEGAFGERHSSHRLYVFPIIGAICGLTVALLLTAGTQVSYPLVTGGKPILSIPPMAIISYEGTMLGAILFTVIGILFESRLPNPKQKIYDTRITEGMIGVVVDCEEEQAQVNVPTREGIEDKLAWLGRREHDALEQLERLLRRVLPLLLLLLARSHDAPHALHLLPFVHLLHQLVVEGVARVPVTASPDDRLGGVREVAAREVGRRVDLEPGDVIEDLVAKDLHGVADAEDDVVRARDPDRAVGLEQALALLEPTQVELVVVLGALGLVPLSLVDRHHPAVLAGDAIIGEEVGRVGKDQVELLSFELLEHRERPDANSFHSRWVAGYCAPEYRKLTGWLREFVDDLGAVAPADQKQRMHAAFRASTRYEYLFWDAAWNSS